MAAIIAPEIGPNQNLTAKLCKKWFLRTRIAGPNSYLQGQGQKTAQD